MCGCVAEMRDVRVAQTAKQASQAGSKRVAQTANKQSKTPGKNCRRGLFHFATRMSIGVGRRRVLSRYAAIFATLPSCPPVILLSVALC